MYVEYFASLQDVFKCACKDQAFKIPADRAKETFLEGAFWCSGTLNMLGTDQNPLVIFNPFSYKYIQDNLIGLDRYLECTSTIGMGDEDNTLGETCESIRPSIQELEDQGVSSIAVLTRCKANYAASQWDEGVSVLFQPEDVFERLTVGKASNAGVSSQRYLANTASKLTAELKSCLLSTAANGQPPDACLTDVFLKDKKKEDYFVYETVTSENGESMLVDACQVYTGPAAAENVSKEFGYCLDNDLETQCNIPSFIWSGRSSGRTPVANYHSWKDTEEEAAGDVKESPKMKRALVEFQGIARTVSQIILAVNQSFADQGITAELFSAEGDALHQVMDCIFMGPYARMDFGSRGTRGTLPVPSWSRRNSESEANTRDLPLPCTGENMQGDFKAPFTCGSQTRRAIIKYFVRSFALPAGVACGTPEVNATVQVSQKYRFYSKSQLWVFNVYRSLHSIM